MTEYALAWEELDNFEQLKRRDYPPAYWSRGRLRRSGRIAINPVAKEPALSATLRRIRGIINADRSVLNGTEAPDLEVDSPIEHVPSKDTLHYLGTVGSSLPAEQLEALRKYQ